MQSTGITIMQMEAGLDTGPMLLAEPLAIGPDETTGQLTVRLADLGGRLLVQALRSMSTLRAEPQPAAGATYANKIDKSEAWLDWRLPAVALARKVRAYDPFPVAQTRLDDVVIRVWRANAEVRVAPADPGTIMAAGPAGIEVVCGQGSLRLIELQRAGGKRLPAREFLAGHPLSVAQRLADGPA